MAEERAPTHLVAAVGWTTSRVFSTRSACGPLWKWSKMASVPFVFSLQSRCSSTWKKYCERDEDESARARLEQLEGRGRTLLRSTSLSSRRLLKNRFIDLWYLSA